MSRANIGREHLLLTVVLPFVLPLGHPLLMPVVGVPSHLLWWAHVLPVAMLSYHRGRWGALGAIPISAAAVISGERLFGAGYGTPAPWATALSLAVGLSSTHLLVAGFALYARSVTARYRSLFSAARSGILRLDHRGAIAAANPAALAILGTSWDGILGRSLRELPDLQDVPDAHTLERAAWSGAICVGSGVARREVHLSIMAFPSGDGDGHQVFLVDRTTEVVQMREIERQGRLSVLGEALAGVAHELKNPLTVIHTYAEMGATSSELPEETREDMETILQQAGRMNDMVQELLWFSRAHSSTGTFHVGDLVRRVLAMQRMAHGSAVRFREQVTWDGEAVGSAAKAEQILANLLANAADAVERGTGEVTVVVAANADRVSVTVRDNGPGIPPEVAERIFEPFLTTKPEGKGTGLGLAISRRLAVTMGGALVLDRSDGPGASFTLELRAAAESGRHAATSASTVAGSGARSSAVRGAAGTVGMG